MKHLITCIVLIIIHLELSSQEWVISDDLNRIEHHLRTERSITENKNIAGTPYLNDEFVKGSIVTTDSLMYRDIPLRYNIYTDEMEFADPGQQPRIIGNPRNFLFFSIEGRTFTYFTFTENNRPEQGYFEVLNNGNCLVLIRRQVVFAQREEAKGYSDARPARFEKRPDQYYLKFDNKLPVEVRLRQRAILAAFDYRRHEIADFIKEKKISFRSVDDLVEVAGYYHLLVTGSGK